MWKTKHSDACSGNGPCGGWGKEGIEAFNDLTEEIKTLRRDHSDAILVVENAAVERFHKVYVEMRKRQAAASGGSYDEDEDGSGGSRASKKSKKASSDQVLAIFDLGE